MERIAGRESNKCKGPGARSWLDSQVKQCKEQKEEVSKHDFSGKKESDL